MTRDATKRPGPFVLKSKECRFSEDEIGPERQFNCSNYNNCLSLAAALNWDSFSCKGCSGTIDQTILWRAKAASKKDPSLHKLCDIPNPTVVTVSSQNLSVNSVQTRETPILVRKQL
jgi:hypothetical protein